MREAKLGSVREIVSRLLKGFEEQGLVRLERGHVRVVDPAGLERIAEPDEDGRTPPR